MSEPTALPICRNCGTALAIPVTVDKQGRVREDRSNWSETQEAYFCDTCKTQHVFAKDAPELKITTPQAKQEQAVAAAVSQARSEAESRIADAIKKANADIEARIAAAVKAAVAAQGGD